ncbi:hypothetical protein BH09ACT10_BH09ACT10_20560 [soil metagenome]
MARWSMYPVLDAKGRTVTQSTHKIVVGFDGSPGSFAAATWALDHAALIGARVEFISATSPSHRPATSGEEHLLLKEHQDQLLDDSAHRYPQVPIRVVSVDGESSEALLLASETATMLVLGHHRTDGLIHSALGSTGDLCARLASCPVVVMPAPVPKP